MTKWDLSGSMLAEGLTCYLSFRQIKASSMEDAIKMCKSALNYAPVNFTEVKEHVEW